MRLLLFIIALACSSCRYSENSNQNRGADHLVPLSAYDHGSKAGYSQAVYRSLIGEGRVELWMVVLPSFSAENAVILRKDEKIGEDTVTVMSEKWYLEYVEAEEMIWNWKEVGGDRMVLDIKDTDKVKRTKVAVQKQFAERLKEAWKLAVSTTRYPLESDSDLGGLDGVTYQFYCNYDYFGETWSPSSGLPREITDIGIELINIANADDKTRKKLISECSKSIESFITKYK